MSVEDVVTLGPTCFRSKHRPELVHEGPEGLPLLSEKGGEFYTAASCQVGMVVDLAAIGAAKEFRREPAHGADIRCAGAVRISAQRREVIPACLAGVLASSWLQQTA